MSNAQARYPWFGVPPTREPRPSATIATIYGKRLVLSTPDGFVYDMRALSERYVNAEGQDTIDVVSEEDYFRLMFAKVEPRVASWAAHLVWVE